MSSDPIRCRVRVAALERVRNGNRRVHIPHVHVAASTAAASVQSVDRAVALLKAIAAGADAGHGGRAGAGLRHQPQHGLAAAVDAGGERAGRARPADPALRGRLRRVPGRVGRRGRRHRAPAAPDPRARGRGDGRDRDAGRRPALQPRLRRPGRSARDAQPELDGPADPAARHLVGQGVPGLAARAGARGAAARGARAPSPTAPIIDRGRARGASCPRSGATATASAWASSRTTPTACRRRCSTRAAGRS